MVTNQAYLFSIFIANGIIIGLLFDFFRIMRKSFKTSDIITYIEDILFWILTGIIVLYSIFIFNNGEIRLFMFLAIGIGLLMYMLTFSSYIIKISVTVINFFKKILLKIFGILSLPFRYLYKLVKKLFLKPISFIIINIRKNITNLLKNIIKLPKSNKKIKNNVEN
ncbi:MAG: spore cortex biosynthesis protein YabQ [Clostridia bacterium]|nr:spore cortex biosynthesis protein YabQ [Clostridia bacterium]